MKYEIEIKELVPFTDEELENQRKYSSYNTLPSTNPDYSSRPHHQTRVLHAEVTKEEFEAVKKAIIGIM